MSNTTTADNLTVTGDLTAVDVVATGCLYTANLTNTGDVSAVDLVASGCVTAANAVISEDVTAACYFVDALSTTATPMICAASYAPGATNYAWPGSLWIRTTGFDLAAGSTRANGLWYMNTSASNAAGSTWTILQGLTTWEP